MEQYDMVIIGGGPAGLAAGLSAQEQGVERVLIIERDQELGGILNQCIHNGFGLHTFQEELTGPEYADRFVQKVKTEKIEYRLHTMIIDIVCHNEYSEPHLKGTKVLTAISKEKGLYEIQAKAVILAMGCRERPRGALNIPGYRPAGIYSAGTAQRLVNMEGYLPGKEVVILGSGDIGLIMARRMTFEGAKVKVVAELMPYSGGLKRNIVQCLDDYDIPLKLSHTVVEIKGKERIEAVVIAKVDEYNKPIKGTEEEYACDTLLLSVGLIPENELSQGMGVDMNPITSGPKVNESLETNLEGVFACGNVLHVHDVVDFVSEEAALAGKFAAKYVREHKKDKYNEIPLQPLQGVRYTVPVTIAPERMEKEVVVRFRVGKVYRNCYIAVYFDEYQIIRKKRIIMAPGEMEEVIISKEKLGEYPETKGITIKIEEA